MLSSAVFDGKFGIWPTTSCAICDDSRGRDDLLTTRNWASMMRIGCSGSHEDSADFSQYGSLRETHLNGLYGIVC